MLIFTTNNKWTIKEATSEVQQIQYACIRNPDIRQSDWMVGDVSVRNNRPYFSDDEKGRAVIMNSECYVEIMTVYEIFRTESIKD